MADEDVKLEDKSRWSYSKTTCFGRCKYEYYLDYIVNDDSQYLSESNFYAEVGSFVHEILAMIFKGELSPDDAPQYYIDNFDKNVFYKVKKDTMDKTFYTCLDYFAEADFSWIDKYEILGVELEQRFKVENIDFIGFIDLLLRDKSDGKIVILDHKSSPYPLKANGEVKKNQQGSFETYKKQMYLYCYAVNELFGELPKEIVWNHFKDGGKMVTIPFNQKEYEKAISWFKDTINVAAKEIEYSPTKEFFYCTQLCNFRNSCEYKKFGE